MLDGLRTRLRSLARRDALEREMSEEMHEHLERTAELLMRRGLSPEEAHLAARREFGNVGVVMEEARDAYGVRWLDDVRRDVRHGARALARSPGFTSVVVVTLALGFGVNGAMFSIMKGALSFSPVPEPSTWVDVPEQWTYRDLSLLRDSSRILSEWSARADAAVALAGQAPGQDPEELRAQFVSAGFFSALRGRPTLGRVFSPEEAMPPVGVPVAVLSHHFWDRRFGRDSSIVGATLRLGDGHPFTVIGVMPPEFVGRSIRTPDLWLPLGTKGRLPGDVNALSDPGDGSWFGAGGRQWLRLSARLAPGASLDAARAELGLRIASLSVGADTAEARIIVAGLRTAADPGMTGSKVLGTSLILGAALNLLLVASATVANLMLARAAARRREMGVRLSLGASRSRVIREWMTECLVLALASAAIGLILSWVTVRSVALSGAFTAVIEQMDPVTFARMFRPDASAVGYMMLLAVLSALVFGLAPALRVTRNDPLASIREGSSGASLRLERVPLRSGLVVAQVALTMVLLLASGMLLRGLVHAMSLDPGFDRHDVIAVSPRLTLSGYDSLRARVFMDDFSNRVGSIRGVRTVARGNVPIENAAFALITRPDEVPAAELRWNGSFNAVSETFFDALGVEIVRGRGFTQAEVRAEAPVAIVSETTARTLWPNAEPIGQVVSVQPGVRGVPGRPREGLFLAARVIGVARDAQMLDLARVPRRYVYVPGDYWTLMLRRNPGDEEITTRLRDLARSIDPTVVLSVRSLEQVIQRSTGWLSSARLTSLFAATLGILSLLMAVVGLFGLTAYAVEQRTREFGVRMALGAPSGTVIRLVVSQGARLVVIGSVLGVFGGMAFSGVLRGMLFGLSPVDPLAYAVVIFLLLSVTTVACLVPAWRATRVDPVIALRAD